MSSIIRYSELIIYLVSYFSILSYAYTVAYNIFWKTFKLVLLPKHSSLQNCNTLTNMAMIYYAVILCYD